MQRLAPRRMFLMTLIVALGRLAKGDDDLCVVLRDPWARNGEELSLKGRVSSTSEDGPWLEPHECKPPMLTPRYVLLMPPDGERDRPWSPKLDEVLASYDPFNEIVVASIRGRFEAVPDARWGHMGGSNIRLVVKDITKVSAEPRTRPVSEAERVAIDIQLRHRAVIIWITMVRILQGPEGDVYFREQIQGRDVPGGAHSVKYFQGRVARVDKDLVDVITAPGGTVPDVRLRVRGEPLLNSRLMPNWIVEFSGVPVAFSRSPFRMEFLVDAKTLRVVTK